MIRITLNGARRKGPAGRFTYGITPSIEKWTAPAVDEMARAIYALFPRCMRCGEPIARYEDADVRILSHRVVHRGACAEAENDDPSVQPAP